MRLIKLGDIVELLEPHKPTLSDVPKQMFYRMYSSLKFSERYFAWKNWVGFTHGIVVEIISQGADGDPHQVSLHLYDPKLGLLYMCNPDLHAIPTYVDFHISELKLYKISENTGYEVVS